MTKIYKITNSRNGKIYVGQITKTLEQRLARHFWAARETGRQKKFYEDILKYGTDNFSIELIEECPDEAADVVESYWIYKLDTINNGYNSCFSYGRYSFSAKSIPNEEYLKQLNKTKFPPKAIDQFTLEGEYIRTFSSAREAEIFLFGNGHKAGRVSFIQQAARGAKSKAYGYKWAYHDAQKAKGEEL